ncbi:inositol monophosphatase [Glycomyces sp. L485]|uniref:inositol monophosphatase family protein n=1 Tax=Glycomyces sp. L485 TaxID=2909235 RepID=UPI001F4AF39F|nr:inositol monophosphatase [Glycomyces sp. L485]MCH7230563.1 inositol monophosphatase [Glycomyces sp. L485]
MSQLPEFLEIAERAVDLAVEVIEAGLGTDRTLSGKGDRDFASDLDLAVEDRLREHLAEATPDIPMLGEERGVTGDTGSDYEWVLDPIDGTVNFVHGLPMYCVSLALTRHGDPAVGVVAAPRLGERYSAATGLGAVLNGSTVACSTTGELSEALVSLPDFAVGERAERDNADRLRLIGELVPRVQRIRMIGSAALDLCWIGVGRLDATMLPQANLWDVAAGVVVAREAGAMVLDRHGEPYGAGSTSVLAMTSGLKSQVGALVAAIG